MSLEVLLAVFKAEDYLPHLLPLGEPGKMAPSVRSFEETKGLKMDLRFQDEAEVKAQSEILCRMEDTAVGIELCPL